MENKDPSYFSGRLGMSRKSIWGAIWCIGGIIVTVVTYNNAVGGGTYYIAYGAIGFGAYQFFQGLTE